MTHERCSDRGQRSSYQFFLSERRESRIDCGAKVSYHKTTKWKNEILIWLL